MCKAEKAGVGWGEGGAGRNRRHINEKENAQEAEEKHKTVRRKKHATEGRSM